MTEIKTSSIKLKTLFKFALKYVPYIIPLIIITIIFFTFIVQRPVATEINKDKPVPTGDRSVSAIDKSVSEVTNFAFINNNWIYAIRNPHYQNRLKLSYDICRSRIDGNDLQVLVRDVSPLTSNIIVAGDNLFFSEQGSLYTVPSNGLGSARIFLDEDIEKILVKDNWIYYLLSSPSRFCIYKMRVDGTSNAKFIELNVGIIADLYTIVGDWIFFKVYSLSKNKPLISIYKIKLDRSGFTKIISTRNNFTNQVIITEAWIYYIEDSSGVDKLYKVSTAGGKSTLLFSGKISSISLYNDYLYYINKNLWRIKIDGTEKLKLCNDKIEWFYIYNNWIYFYTQRTKLHWESLPNSDYRNFYRIKIDGSQRIKL